MATLRVADITLCVCVYVCVCAQQLEQYSSPLSLRATSAFLHAMAHWERNPN